MNLTDTDFELFDVPAAYAQDVAALDARWKWAARDEDGSVWVYSKRPDLGIRVWDTFASFREITRLFANFDPGNKPWNESLISRHEVV